MAINDTIAYDRALLNFFGTKQAEKLTEERVSKCVRLQPHTLLLSLYNL